MYSALDDAALPAPGFPIRKSTGQWLFSASPWLIAAVHVLLRLLVPRHPPCALTILTVSCSCVRDARAQSTRAKRVSSASYPWSAPAHLKGRSGAPPTRKWATLGLVQFSRSTEARTTTDCRWRSLKTEQRTQCHRDTGEPGRRSREISLERR